jgi:hypothetical protein
MRKPKLLDALLLLVMALAAAGLGVLLEVRAAAPAEAPAQDSTLQVIGLPYAGILALQHINELGLTQPASATVRFASPDGTTLKTITNPALPPESVTFYTGTDDPADAAWTSYPTSPEQGTRVFGVSYQISPAGNTAYLGVNYDSAIIPQYELYRLWIVFQVKGVDGWSSAFVLQNRSSQFMANLALTFFNDSGYIVCQDIAAIPAGGSQAYYLESLGCLPPDFTGSAVASSDQPLAVSATRLVYQPADLACDYRGITPEEMSTHLVVPALFKDHDLQTSTLCVWNTGSVETMVSVAYSDGLADNALLAPNASWCLNQASEAHAAGWVGAAEVAAGQPLGAVVRVLANGGSGPAGCWAYTATPSRAAVQAGGTGLALPLLLNDEEWSSRTYLYNEGDAPATLELRLVSSSGTVYCPEPVVIPPHSARVLEPGDLPLTLRQGMAYMGTTEPVAAAVGMTSKQPVGATDRHMGYRAAYGASSFLMPDTCSGLWKVLLPLVVRH